MTLDPDAAAFLERLRAAAPPAPGVLTPGQLREANSAGAPAVAGPGRPVQEVRDVLVGGVPARSYRPADARGTTVYLHGGGWVVGTLDTYDVVARALAVESGTTVVSVDYDLAPEVRHPGQLRQSVAALQAVAEAAEGPVSVAGDSAGAHLAVLTAVTAGVLLAGAALVYPVVSPALDTASARDNATGYALETEGMRWYWEQYLTGAPSDVPVDLLQTDLGALPPTLVVTAGFDPLRDEGLVLADAAEAAGVPVERLAFPGQVHGFFRMPAVMAQAGQAYAAVGDFLRRRSAP